MRDVYRNTEAMHGVHQVLLWPACEPLECCDLVPHGHVQNLQSARKATDKYRAEEMVGYCEVKVVLFYSASLHFLLAWLYSISGINLQGTHM